MTTRAPGSDRKGPPIVSLVRYREFSYAIGLDRCKTSGLLRFDNEDRWHPGMWSGSGWTDIVSLTLAGYRHAFPETTADGAETGDTAGSRTVAELLVLADDYQQADDVEQARRSRISAASC